MSCTMGVVIIMQNPQAAVVAGPVAAASVLLIVIAECSHVCLPFASTHILSALEGCCLYPIHAVMLSEPLLFQRVHVSDTLCCTVELTTFVVLLHICRYCDR